MATPAQAAAATAGAGSLAAAGAYGITQAVNGAGEEITTDENVTQENPEMPESPITFTAQDLTGNTYTDKFLGLTKTDNLQNLVKAEDKKWWDWAFKNKYEKLKVGKQAHSIFASVNNSETLKAACDSAYKAAKTDYSFEANHHLLQNISDYCTKTNESIDISEPKAVTFANVENPGAGYESGVLSVATNKPFLVKNEESNKLWWEWAYKFLWTGKSEGQEATFVAVTANYSSGDVTTALNKVCDEAYKKGKTDLEKEGSKLLQSIKKFCTIGIEEKDIKAPETARQVTTTPLTLDSEGNHTKSTYTTGIGSKQEHKSKLVDPKPTENKTWWENKYTSSSFPSSASSDATLDDLFKSVTKAHVENLEETTATALNSACNLAYKKTENDLKSPNDKLLKNINKYCTKGSETVTVPS